MNAFLILLIFCMLSSILTQDILKQFQSAGCLKGTVELEGGNLVYISDDMDLEPGETYLLNEISNEFETFSETDVLLNVQSKTVLDDSKRTFQKSPTMLVNELARHNIIDISFKLVAEHGPSHQKKFIINLQLGDENYEGIANSLKKAKQAASAKALKTTKYEHPPLKTIENKLYTLAKERNEDVVFMNEYGQLVSEAKKYASYPSYIPKHNVYGSDNIRMKLNYVENQTSTAENETHVDYKFLNLEHSPDDPYIIRLQVGNREYTGIGYTINAARHDASVKAVEEIKQLNKDAYCLTEVDCEQVQANLLSKSAVSLVHEIATARDMRIIFSVIKEEGPSHAKIFTIRCQVNDFVTEAEGKSKKIAKRIAAELMLEKFKKLGWDKVSQGKKQKRRTKKQQKKSNIDKENVKISVEIPDIIYEKEPTLIKETKVQKVSTNVKKSAKDTLLELAQKLGVVIQFWDLPKNNYEKYLTFASMTVDPPQVCFGSDTTLETSRDKASLRALEILESNNLHNVYVQDTMYKEREYKPEESLEKDEKIIYSYNEKNK